jgi:membrane associated rhomboid family serine protease
MLGINLTGILGLHYFQTRDFYIYQLVTYMFTHREFFHLFFNMFALFMFGGLIEKTWGPKRFLTYYLVTGIGAGLIQMLVIFIQTQHYAASLSFHAVNEVQNAIDGVQDKALQIFSNNGDYFSFGMADLNALFNSVTIGASGAVFGLLLAFGMLFPNLPLYFMFIPIPIKAKYLVIGYGVIEFFFGIANHDNVAHFAHLGGMLFGILMIFYWNRKRKNRFSRRKKKPEAIYIRPESDWEYNKRKNDQSKELDRILDKIKKSGYNSLSEDEKKTLFETNK